MKFKNHHTVKGQVSLYKSKGQFMVYGDCGALQFHVRVNCPVEAENIYSYWQNRIYVAPVIPKDRVKMAVSPSTMVTEI